MTSRLAPRSALRSATAWELVAVLVFTAWIAWPFVAPGGYVTDYDTVTYSGPNLVATFRAWDQGRMPWWEPGIFGGSAFAGNVQTAVFYPLKLAAWPLGAASAMGALTAVHLALLAVGTWWLARRTLRLAPPAGLVAAVIMVGSGTTMVRAVRFEQIAVVAWIPWLLIAVDHLVRAVPGQRRRAVAATAATTALVVLSGHPNQALIGALTAAAWAALRVREHRPDDLRGTLLQVAAGVGLGAAIAALPLVLALPLFPRIGVPTSTMLHEATFDRYALDPLAAIPRFLGDAVGQAAPADRPTLETPVFLGAAAILLAVYGARRGLGRDRVTRRGLVGLVVASIVIALGPHALVYRLLAVVVPGFGNGRVPLRWVFVTTLAVALLAGAGVDALARRRAAENDVPADRRLRPMLISAAIIGVAVFVPWGERGPAWGGRLVWLVAGGAVLAVVFAARTPLRSSPLARPGTVAALVVTAVVVVELGLPAGSSYGRTLRSPQPFTAQHRGAVERFLADRGDRALEVSGTNVNANLTTGWRSLDGYDGGLWLTTGYVEMAQRLSDRPYNPIERLGDQVRRPLDAAALAGVGVRFAVVDPTTEPRRRLGREPDEREVADERHRLVPDWTGPVLVDGTKEVWENPAFLGEAVVVDGDRRAGAELRRHDDGSLDVTTRATGRLVVAEQALPGWSATVDGAPVELVDADGFSLAVDVPAGRHEVAFRYRPPGLVLGATTSLLAVVLTLALAVLPRRRRDAGD